MRPSTRAWTALGIGVVGYDLLCPPGETLSEGLDNGLEHPIFKYLLIGAIGTTALHLCNIFEVVGLERYDPLSRSLDMVKKFR